MNKQVFIHTANNLINSDTVELAAEHIEKMLIALAAELDLPFEAAQISEYVNQINCRACTPKFCEKRYEEIFEEEKIQYHD